MKYKTKTKQQHVDNLTLQCCTHWYCATQGIRRQFNIDTMWSK